MKILMAYFENLAGLTGGLEKTLCRLSNELTKRGHKVVIVTYDENYGRPYYPLKDTVDIINLRKDLGHKKMGIGAKVIREWARLKGKESYGRWKESQRQGIIKDIIDTYKQINPDVTLAYNHRTMGELYSAGICSHVIAMFRNDPQQLCQQMTKLQIKSIEDAAAVQVLLPSYKSTISKYISNPNIVCIPNAIEQAGQLADIGKHPRPFTILNVARFNKKQKRQMLLVQAFALLADEYPDWRLKIWGGGEESYKHEIEKVIRKNHLANRVLLMGRTPQIKSEYLKADIFCFPSRFEGFPNALGEAMTSGLPCVVCNDCQACSDLVTDGIEGMNSELTADAIAEKLKFLMKNVELRIRMGQKAHERMIEFRPETIWNQWEDLIISVGKEKKTI